MEHDSMTSETPSQDRQGMQVPGGGFSFDGNTFGIEPFLPHPDALVMTDEQLETLRRQISVYATICHQLVEMHKASILQPPRFSGLQHIPYDPLTGLHKTTSRQRWTPTQTQLQILERLFEQGHGTPSKQRIKEITAELSRHGPIADTNVYNWFQNRKARAKRKQASISQKDGESEADTDGDSPADKRSKRSRDTSGEQENCAQKSAVCFEQSNSAARPPRERSLSSLFRDTTICKGSLVGSVQAEANGRSWPASLEDGNNRLPLQQRFSNGSFGMSSSYQNGCLNYGGISLDASQIFNDVHS